MSLGMASSSQILENTKKIVEMVKISIGKESIYALVVLLESIKKEIDVNAQTDESGQVLLHYAAERGLTDIVIKLLALGASVDIQDKNGRTPLYRAIMGKYINTVRELLVVANIHIHDENGRTPLHIAAINGYTEIVQVLLAARAGVDIPDCYGRTALHYAAEDGYANIALELLAVGARFDIKDNSGQTALERVDIQYYPDTIRMLLDIGLSSSSQSLENIKDFFRRAQIENTKMFFKIIKKVQFFPGFFPGFINENVFNLIKLIRKGIDVNAQIDGSGKTPLNYAADKGSLDIVEELLALRASTDIPDCHGCTPLHWAARNGNSNIVRALISAGASVDIQDNSGHTPLYYAVRHKYITVARKLLAKGARIDIKDKNGQTLLAGMMSPGENTPLGDVASLKAFLEALIDTVKNSLEESIFLSEFNRYFKTQHNNVNDIVKWIMVEVKPEVEDEVIEGIETLYFNYQNKDKRFGKLSFLDRLFCALDDSVELNTLEENMAGLNISGSVTPCIRFSASNAHGAASSSVRVTDDEIVHSRCNDCGLM